MVFTWSVAINVICNKVIISKMYAASKILEYLHTIFGYILTN